MTKHRLLWAVALMSLIGLAACRQQPAKPAVQHSQAANPVTHKAQTTTVTLTGIIYRLDGQALFLYGQDMTAIKTVAALQAYFADGVAINEGPYATASDKVQVAAYVLKPTPKLTRAFAPNTTVRLVVPLAQAAVTRKLWVDLQSVTGIPTASTR
ncbi:MAG: hypothetical protein LKJ69_06655 [Lactobacillus sp.]|jgi:hypothetical protein|nr:hypothetical protein [Lactobacillus sp.]MCI2033070.1 hypothetical protein [Lactobacillus sp.]